MPLIPTLVDDLAGWRGLLTAQKAPERHRKATGKPKPGDLVIAQPGGSPWTTADYGNWRARIFEKHIPADAHPGALGVRPSPRLREPSRA